MIKIIKYPELLNPDYVGKRWWIRTLILIIYIGIFSVLGDESYSNNYSLIKTVYLSAIFIIPVTIIILWAIRNLFLRRHLQFGFFTLMFIFIGGCGSVLYNGAENRYNTYIESKDFQDQLKQIQATLEREELPYTSSEEMQDYLLSKFPLLDGYLRELWKYKCIRSASGLYGFLLLIIYFVFVIIYEWKKRHLDSNKVIIT